MRQLNGRGLTHIERIYRTTKWVRGQCRNRTMRIVKRIRQFFWMTTGLSLLSIFTNFSPVGLVGKIAGQGDGSGQALGDFQGRAMDIAQRLGVKVGASNEKTAAYAGAALGVEPGSVNSNEPVYSSSGKSMLWKGKRYVLIHGKWIIERADGTYTVDGMRVVFRDSGKFADTRTDVSQTAGRELAAGQRRGMSGQELKKAQGLLQRVSDNPFAAYSAESLEDMAKTMEAAKKAMEDRNRMLKELTEAK